MPENDDIQGRDIVMVGQQPWDTGIGSNAKNIAVEFSKNNRVLYVNNPLDRISMIRGRQDAAVQKRLSVIKGTAPGLVVLDRNLWNLYPSCLTESINKIGPGAVFDLLNRRNNKLFARSIQNAISELGFRDVILFNDNEIFKAYYLKELLRPDISIYYSRDYMLAVDYWKHHGQRLEPRLIAKSDLCVANSTYLADYCRKYNPRSYYVGQGCELDMFTGHINGQPPTDMTRIAGPVIGYVGVLQSIRLDIDLIAYIAEQRPGWNIVLVGPEDEVFRACRLHALPNVIFTGARDAASLPSYLMTFDVCINPQLVNEVTIGNYPRKIDEYLAMGKPVVATRTEAMNVFSDHTYLAENRQQYIQFIEQALDEKNSPNAEKTRAARVAFARSHSWENSVQEIYRAILSLKT